MLKKTAKSKSYSGLNVPSNLRRALFPGQLVLGLVAFFYSIDTLQAAGKKKPGITQDGKKVIAIAPVENLRIEMPDQSLHDFGADYQASLTAQLIETDRYLVSDPLPEDLTEDQRKLKIQSSTFSDSSASAPEYSWDGRFVPTATVKVHVEALNFTTGSRGERSFYGFDERQKNSFNDGRGEASNEFPLRLLIPDTNWFGKTFKSKGFFPMDSRTGLDLGDGFGIDFLYAWLTVKYAQYHSELHIKLEIESPEVGKSETRLIQVTGNGFFFDVAGQYEGYSLGISMARKDAMEHALRKALLGSFSAIDRALSEIPMIARVDAVMRDGTILIGTGPEADVRSGVLYEIIDHPEVVIEVTSAVTSGAVGRVVAGELSQVQSQQILRQVFELPTARLERVLASTSGNEDEESTDLARSSFPVSTESITLATENIPKIDFKGTVKEISKWAAFGKSVVESVFLPYRIWRYFRYDQSYHKDADQGMAVETWLAHPSIAHLPQVDIQDEKRVPVIAVIDSGIDYNHPLLHSSLWLNANPTSDPSGRQDRYGWGFVSNDSKPFDDHFHGSQVASVVAQVAPFAKLMPLKVFNPWGITSSSAIYSAFVYAVDHGATMILCAWATPRFSHSIEMGISYAHQKGVAVVAAAGDDGVNLDFTPYYPAVYSRSFENVITVTAIDDAEQMSQISGRKVSYSSTLVSLAAPGTDIRVAEPRSNQAQVTSTGVAAAFVAGALARYAARDLQELTSNSYPSWIESLYQDADEVMALKPYVKKGLKLNIKK